MRFQSWFFVFLLAYGIVNAGLAPSWRVKHRMGAHQLAISELRQIVLPESVDSGLMEAVTDLREIASMRGISLKISSNKWSKQSIILEHIPARKSFQDGGYEVVRDRSRLIVRASSNEGLSHALYGLCQDLFGARWYWPDEIGLELIGEVPAHFPDQRWRQRPAFVHRRLYPSNTDYARRNRLSGKYQFNHNLANVFTKELYHTNPEVFAEVRESRSEPKGSTVSDPQPDFTNPLAVEIAAEAALLHFKENPGSQSFSLSINDNVRFDESAATQAAVEPLRFFRQRPDYTDLVFTFMNRVAEEVFNKAGAWSTPSGEPRYLTALAYYWTEASPSIVLHPRVMPVLTSDRAQWQDPDYREEDRALIQRWCASGAERVATWDYYFGAPYPYPRQFNRWIEESIQYLHQSGVDVFFSQLPGAWGLDGAKAWLTSRLLWNPHENAADLLDEFYSQFFGPAAESMRRFYELAEEHREKNVGKADWIKFYLDEAGIELMTPQLLEAMQACIDEASTEIELGSRFAERVGVVAQAFRLTRDYAAMHQARRELVLACIQEDASGLPELLHRFHDLRAVFLSYSNDLIQNPFHERLRYFTRMAQSDPTPLALMRLQSMPVGLDSIAATVMDWRAGKRVPVVRNIFLRHLEGSSQRFSFLGPDLPVIPGWHFNFRPYEHFTVRAIREGWGIHISGTDMCSVFTEVSVDTGDGYVLEFDCKYSISPDNRTQVYMDWYDEDIKLIQWNLPVQLPRGTSERIRLRIPAMAPEGAKILKVRFLISRQGEGDYFELHRVRVDRVPLTSLPKE
ncbi:MAG: DUF4838 domain-containing protein [Coraliomargaritaceae bacterium]